VDVTTHEARPSPTAPGGFRRGLRHRSSRPTTRRAFVRVDEVARRQRGLDEWLLTQSIRRPSVQRALVGSVRRFESSPLAYDNATADCKTFPLRCGPTLAPNDPDRDEDASGAIAKPSLAPSPHGSPQTVHGIGGDVCALVHSDRIRVIARWCQPGGSVQPLVHRSVSVHPGWAAGTPMGRKHSDRGAERPELVALYDRGLVLSGS
jgi:hypothetical protein